MGNDIRETSVDFNTRKKLTHEQLKEVIKYCKHDVANYSSFYETF